MTGSFTNFRRLVFTGGATPFWTSANYGVSSTTGAVVQIAPSISSIYVNGMVAATISATVATQFYFAFEYSSNNILI
jgi:hypothetical protein